MTDFEKTMFMLNALNNGTAPSQTGKKDPLKDGEEMFNSIFGNKTVPDFMGKSTDEMTQEVADFLGIKKK